MRPMASNAPIDHRKSVQEPLSTPGSQGSDQRSQKPDSERVRFGLLKAGPIRTSHRRITQVDEATITGIATDLAINHWENRRASTTLWQRAQAMNQPPNAFTPQNPGQLSVRHIRAQSSRWSGLLPIQSNTTGRGLFWSGVSLEQSVLL